MLFNAHTHINSKAHVAILNAEGRSDLPPYYSLGIHPWNAEKGIPYQLKEALKASSCLALGEAGLDKLKGPDLELQKTCFIEQVHLSEELGLPIIIHCVKAWNELRAIKRDLKPKQTWIYHGFSKANLIEEVVQEGLMISIGAAVLTNKKLQDKIAWLPLDRILVETDDSDLSIEWIYEQVSALKNIPLPRLEKQIEENFKRVFTKWKIG